MSSFKQISFAFKKFSFFVLVFIAVPGSVVHSADVILTWERPNDTRVTGYKIFYGFADTDFKSLTKKTINAPDQTSYNIYGLKTGNTYGFAAKSFDSNGNESVFSEVLYYDVSEKIDKKSSVNDSENNDDGGSGGGGCFIMMISDLITRN